MLLGVVYFSHFDSIRSDNVSVDRNEYCSLNSFTLMHVSMYVSIYICDLAMNNLETSSSEYLNDNLMINRLNDNGLI